MIYKTTEVLTEVDMMAYLDRQVTENNVTQLHLDYAKSIWELIKASAPSADLPCVSFIHDTDDGDTLEFYWRNDSKGIVVSIEAFSSSWIWFYKIDGNYEASPDPLSTTELPEFLVELLIKVKRDETPTDS